MLRKCSCILFAREFHTTGLAHITCLSLLITNCLNFSFYTWENWSFIWFDYITNWRADHNFLKWRIVKHVHVFVSMMSSRNIQMLRGVQFIESWFVLLVILWSNCKPELRFAFLLKFVLTVIYLVLINFWTLGFHIDCLLLKNLLIALLIFLTNL